MNIDYKLPSDLLHILQHSLGVDGYGIGRSYRNRFVTGPGGDDFSKCGLLVEMGYMEDRGPQEIAGGMHCFVVTPLGESAMRENSPRPPKLTKSKQNYQAFLKADCGMTFKQWISRK